VTRIVQVSDTHISAAGPPPTWQAFRSWLLADPPDLLVHTGDIVIEDPDNALDRAAARRLFDELDVDQLFIPGNHDVGYYDQPRLLPARLDEFRSTWGGDRFACEIGGWRLIGVDAYLLGHDSDLGREHDAWFSDSLRVGGSTIVFVHQPPFVDRIDGWEMAQHACDAFAAAIAGRDIALVASGHRHCSALLTVDGQRTMWAPSLTFSGGYVTEWLEERGAEDIQAATGVVDYRLLSDGSFEVRTVPIAASLPR